MIAKVREVFLNNDFEEKECEFGYLYSMLSKTRKEVYWLISNKGLDSALEKQSEYLNLCKEKIDKDSFEKNCNLLILEKIDSSKDNSKLFSKILDIEEDPYMFRKYILYYTEDELNELNGLIKNDGFNNFIIDNASEASFFDKYKNNKTIFNGYSLLYRLMIKLPFLKIKSKEDTLDDLKSNFEKLLIKEELLEDYEKITKLLECKSVDEITNTDSSELLENLITNFGGVSND